MIVRVLTGSILFVLIFSPPNGHFATPLDGNAAGNSTEEQPSNTSLLNETNADTSVTLVSSVNKTGMAIDNGGIPGTGEELGRTGPNVREDSGERLENKDWTKSRAKISNARDTYTRYSYTREVETSTTLRIVSSLLRQQDLETSHDESTSAADQDLIGKPREVHPGYSSVAVETSSPSFKKHSTDRTTSSRAFIFSSEENVLENESTRSSRKAAGITKATTIMAGPAGKLEKTTGPGQNVSLFTVSPAVDPAIPVFKMEAQLDQTFGTTAADDQMTQTDDVRNWKRDVNATWSDVTKAGLAYKSLWDDEETEDEEGKTEADGGGVEREESSRKAMTGGATEPKGSGKTISGKREENGRFTIPAELRKARNRNEHFSLSFHGLPWRDELNILVPVLCGMFGAMLLVLAAYFLRNCPNNIRHLARMSRPSKLHRRKSDLNLLIDYSSGDDHP